MPRTPQGDGTGPGASRPTCARARTLVRHLHYEILNVAEVLHRREVLTGAEVRAAMHDAYPPIKEVHRKRPGERGCPAGSVRQHAVRATPAPYCRGGRWDVK